MVAVIGAGPIGLSVAYYLSRQNIPYRVFERQTVGWSWANFYDRLHLNTARDTTALPGMPMPAHYPVYPSRDAFLAYLRDYASRFDLAISTQTVVEQVAFSAKEGWTLATTQGRFQARVLVTATGSWALPHRPELPAEQLFGGPVTHAHTYRNPVAFQGQRVLVVGAGSSGCEIAVDLSEQGVSAAISIREGVYLTPRAPAARWQPLAVALLLRLPAGQANTLLQRTFRSYEALGIPRPLSPPLCVSPVVDVGFIEAVRAGRITVVPGVERCLPGGVRFTDGREEAFDAIILATGYRPAIGLVRKYLDCDADGYPLLAGWRSTRNRWLYCPGFWYRDAAHWFRTFQQVARAAVAQILRDHGRALR